VTRLARWAYLVGVLATVVGLSKVHAAWLATPVYDYTSSARLGWSLALAALLTVVAYGVGLPDLPRTRRSALAASVAAAAAAAVGMSLVQLVVGDALLPRVVVFGSSLLVVPLGVAANALCRSGADRAEQRERVVLVAPVEEAHVLRGELAGTPVRPASIIAHVHPDVAGGHGRQPLIDAAVEADATLVVLDRQAQQDDRVVAQAAELHERGVRVRTLSLFYEEWLGKLPVSELERVSLFFDIGELHRARYGRAKRVLDVVLGVAGLVPLALAVPVVLVANLVANRGPLLYRQERVGRFGEHFSILKFRTMTPAGGGALVDEWTSPDDPRITPFGRIMRRTHLDELPQVVNILRGDLSVVGPRPEQPGYVAELTEKLPFYGLRHLVRPGLTGWAQVTYGYAGDESDALEKLQYEFFYLRRQGIALDLRVVGRTLRTIFGSQGRGR
jgi:lipopolysaccharide/colanic/teichoic acid biosynthesis glycosyltransferase